MTRTLAAPGQLRVRRELSGRAIWIVLDQAVSSLANAGLSVVVARMVSPAEFGTFALAFSIYTFLVAISQGLCGQVFMIRYSGEAAGRTGRPASGATGAAAMLGIVAAGVLTVSAIALGPGLREVLVSLGVLMPALLVQDTWRTVFVARGTPSRAFLNDLVWTVLQVVLIAGLLMNSVHDAMWYVLAWGAAAAAAAALGVKQARSLPSLRAAVPFVRDNRDISVPSVGGAFAILGATQVAFVLISAVGSVADVGGLRAAQTLLGPLNILGFALTALSLPEIARRDLSRRQLTAAAAAISAVMVIADVGWGLVLLSIPESLGADLLGETWVGARDALPGLIIFTACIGSTVGATLVIRSLARADYAMWTQALLGVLVITLGVAGVSRAGTSGAAWGLAAAAALMVMPCWILLVRSARLGRREPKIDTGRVDKSEPRSHASPRSTV